MDDDTRWDLKIGHLRLVRMSGDVYGLSTAVQEGDEMSQLTAAEVIAQEVSRIQFQYFDGTVW